LHAATSDPAEQRALWALYTGPLLGMLTGDASGLSVLDVDPRMEARCGFEEHTANSHGETHRQTLPEAVEVLPQTFSVSTPSGGLHFYFHHCPGLRCSQGRIAPGVDVSAGGGYVVLWDAAGLTAALRAGASAPWPEWLG